MTDPWHFEKFFHFAGHLFEEPPDEDELKLNREATVEAERERVMNSLEDFWSGAPATGPNVPEEEL